MPHIILVYPDLGAVMVDVPGVPEFHKVRIGSVDMDGAILKIEREQILVSDRRGISSWFCIGELLLVDKRTGHFGEGGEEIHLFFVYPLLDYVGSEREK